MKIGIIGAGASGMMAAVTAADCGARVIILEKNDRVGKKILATGNGKCNLGNLDFNLDKYYCDDKKKLEKIFSLFSFKDTIAFFEGNGLLIKDKNGYLYPYSEQASSVLDVFRRMLKERHIEVFTETEIASVFYQKKKKCFAAESRERRFEFDRLILSCGGPASLKRGQGMSGFHLAEGFRHSLKQTVPGLVQLCSSDAFLKGMAGVRVQAGLELFADGRRISGERGELQFTDHGISGIPVFQFSREAGYALSEGRKTEVKINLFPDFEENDFLHMIQKRFGYMEKADAALEEFLLGMVNKKINTALMKYAGLKPDEKIAKLGYGKIEEFMRGYQNLTVHIDGTNGMENAQVCAGGVKFSEVDISLQSMRQKGLYLTGELLDVDGKCGGYNLQWAWTSGYVAGRSAAESMG